MTAPTDEQIEDLAKFLHRFESKDVLDSWETYVWQNVLRARSRAAWDHVARQIMPVQVGDTVRYHTGAYSPLDAVVFTVEIQADREDGPETMYYICQDDYPDSMTCVWARLDQLTLITDDATADKTEGE